MSVKFVTNEKIAETSSKGNQEKWYDGSRWYKLDQFGYEALTETLISRLLERSSIEQDTPFRFTRYWTSCSLIIIDDVMYTGVSMEDLMAFYQSIMLLNESRSVILITNRELSSWSDAAEDKHLIQTLIDRITAHSQIIRLN